MAHPYFLNQTTKQTDSSTGYPEIEDPDYTKEERDYLKFLIKRACNDRDARDRHHPELDDMSYLEYYDNNRKKDLSYIPPKENRQDVRIVTGTTREKDTTLLSSMLNLNLEPDVSAFDENNLFVSELGSNMEDMVMKSREMEDYDRKRSKIYRELISQGDVFVRDIWVDKFRPMPLEEVKWKPTEDSASKINFKERLKKVYSQAEVQMIAGKNVYLGDMSIEYAQDQPRVTTLNVMSRDEAKEKYGEWERWDNVPYQIDTTKVYFSDSSTYKTWSLVEHDHDEVAEVTVFDAANNRLMILLNGVMMLPIDYPLTAINPSGEIPITQGKFEIISDFAYSKSQPSKTKVDQAVIDESTKLIIEKFRQGAKPPKGNTSKKVFGSEIYRAGRITSNIREGQLFDIIDNPGVSAADFSFYQLFKESINEKSTNEIFAGDAPEGGDITATEAVQRKEQQLMKLGAAMDGVVNLERGMVWQRIYTIVDKWTDPERTKVVNDDESSQLVDIYRTISVSTTLENGEKGIKEFRFRTDPEEFPDEAELEMQEERRSEEQGQTVRIVYMNPKKVNKFRGTWYVQITPTPKNQDKLSQLIFVQQIQEAMAIFGPESLNMEYLKQRYAVNIGEDYNKMFKKMDVMDMVQMSMEGNQEVVSNARGAIRADKEQAANNRQPQQRLPASQMAR